MPTYTIHVLAPRGRADAAAEPRTLTITTPAVTLPAILEAAAAALRLREAIPGREEQREGARGDGESREV